MKNSICNKCKYSCDKKNKLDDIEETTEVIVTECTEFNKKK